MTISFNFFNFYIYFKYFILLCSATSQFEYDQAPRVSSSLSVSTLDIVMQTSCSPAMSTLTLTPGRTRDIDQDMQALRLSRQDNPFLQVFFFLYYLIINYFILLHM